MQNVVLVNGTLDSLYFSSLCLIFFNRTFIYTHACACVLHARLLMRITYERIFSEVIFAMHTYKYVCNCVILYVWGVCWLIFVCQIKLRLFSSHTV